MNTSLGQTGNDLDSAEPMNSEKKMRPIVTMSKNKFQIFQT